MSNGTTAVIGAEWLDIYGNSSGAIYVFKKSEGSWLQTFAIFDNAPHDHFGASVALSGNIMFVGAPDVTVNGNTGQGAVFVFANSGSAWSQMQELVASDGAAGDNFGSSVALDGTTALVGAFHATVSGNAEQGAAYVFTSSEGSWSQSQKLIADNGAAYDFFGNSVAISGTTALVGAFEAVPNNGIRYRQGTVYVFDKASGSWSQTQELTADSSGDDNIGDYWFGWSVALSGTTAVVGAPFEISNRDTFAPGTVYVFTESDGIWSQTQKIPDSSFQEFGYSVALSGTTVLIGAPGVSNNINDTRLGAAYIFTESAGTWSQAQQINASDEWNLSNFGTAVALSGSTALVGAPDTYGRAYFYTKGDVGLTVSQPATVDQNQQYVSQTIVTNEATAVSPAVAVTMLVPASASFISATATQGICKESIGIVICAFGQINDNAGTATANVTLKAAGNPGATIKNTVSIKGSPRLTAGAETTIEKSNPPPPPPPPSGGGGGGATGPLGLGLLALVGLLAFLRRRRGSNRS